MMSKNTLFMVAALSLAIAWIGGVGVYKGLFRYLIFSPSWHYKGVVLSTNDCTAQNPEIITLKNGCLLMYTHGWESPGSSENNTYAFSSCDGKNWKKEGLILKNASMPTAVALPDEKIRLYFARASEVGGKRTNGIMSAISSDGLHFTEEEGYRIVMAENAPRDTKDFREYYPVTGVGDIRDIKAFAHLNAIRMDGGYRIYFDEGGMRADLRKYGDDMAWPLSRGRSIFSEDGLHFRLDPGTRIDVGEPPLSLMQRSSNPSVLKLDDGYHMFFFAGFSPWEDITAWKRLAWSGTYEALSSDGLHFTILNIPRFSGNDAAVIKMGDIVRAYPSRGLKNIPGCNEIMLFEKKL